MNASASRKSAPGADRAWLPPLLSFAASVVFAIVLAVETATFRRDVQTLDAAEAHAVTTALDLCECAAGLVGACAVASILLLARRLKRRLDRVAAENAAIRRHEAFRRASVSNVTHEIRTPLTGILAAVELLDAEAAGGALDGAERRALLAVLRSESARLDRLAQDILSLARIEARAESDGRGEMQEAELAEILAQVHVRMKPKAEVAGVELAVVRAARVRRRCDAELVEQALANLVENALRHSGSPRIELTLAAGADGRGVFTVADFGVGIPAADRARVFERFYRVDKARSRAQGGTGLGLAIVKHIAQLHGGAAALECPRTGGCRFTLSI